MIDSCKGEQELASLIKNSRKGTYRFSVAIVKSDSDMDTSETESKITEIATLHGIGLLFKLFSDSDVT